MEQNLTAFENHDLDAKETLSWQAHGIGGFIAHTSKGSYRLRGKNLYFLARGGLAEENLGIYADPKKQARKHFNQEI